MKTIIKSMLMLTCLVGLIGKSQAQNANNTSKLAMGKVEPYQMEVTYTKTSHLIFPAAIRYVDLGSEYLIAGKAEDAENVLRIKATVRDFEEETNFSVITEDGRFYNFNVFYSSYPSSLNYDLLTMQKQLSRENENDVLFLLKGVYIHNGKFYFHTELRNKSNVPFQIDFVNFKIVDKKIAKRTVIQEKPMKPLRIYKPLDEIIGNTTEQNVFLLDQFTITDDKVLLIEIFEKNGGRHQVLQIENSDLVNARLINTMHLKIN